MESNIKKLKIIMFDAAFPPPVVGGKEKQAFLLAKRLVAKGINVDALSYRHNSNTSEKLEGINIHRVNPGISSLPPLILHLIKSRTKAKILHIHTPSKIGKILTFIGFALGYKIVFKFPGQDIINDNNFSSKILWYTMFKTVSLFVVLEDNTYQKLTSLSINKNKIFYVHNGVEMHKNKKTIQYDKKINLIFIGRLVPIKLCDQMIYACSLLHKKGIDFKLTIVGDGPLTQDLIDLTKELQLENHVFFEGHKSNTISYMEKSDILILPSLSEGMSNVLLEAISVGLPIVATNVGSASTQVGTFGKQFLCDPYKPESLAEKIIILTNDPKLREKYGSYLYNRGCEMFSIEAVTNKYISKYKELL